MVGGVVVGVMVDRRLFAGAGTVGRAGGFWRLLAWVGVHHLHDLGGALVGQQWVGGKGGCVAAAAAVHVGMRSSGGLWSRGTMGGGDGGCIGVSGAGGRACRRRSLFVCVGCRG